VSLRILAIDVTNEHGSLALIDEDRIVEEASLHAPAGFGEILFGEIEALLARHAIRLAEIDAFASASGPGTFTGVRMGLTAVKGLAEGSARKTIGISNLQALAWFGSRPLRATVLDARRGEVYGAVYDAALRPAVDEAVMKFPAWLETLGPWLPGGDLEFITAGYPIPDNLGKVTNAPSALAGAIGLIAMQRLRDGLGQDPAAIDANYVRRPDAQPMRRES
jgi:tRNA threonylcarbamoyladenosine biosynthesis protein TsaB